MSDEEAPAPVPEVKQELPPKNKRRKAVDKTYLDDEGFMGIIIINSQISFLYFYS